MDMDDEDNVIIGAGLDEEHDQTDITDTTDTTDRSLITDISDAMGLISPGERARRRKQQLREALVAEHLQERERGKSRLAILLRRNPNRE